MGFIINEEKYINENIFRHEKRINSQVGRFLDKSPSYVTYYHINKTESSVDLGLQNVDKVLGKNSPIRFNKVKSFPIYGIDQIVVDLDFDDMGMDGSFDGGEGIILPNTIIPQPNDFFTISYLETYITFMVTSIQYDTIRSNNYYKIQFTLKSVSDRSQEDLERQTKDKFTCVLENIGTEDNAIIRDDVLVEIVEFKKAYANIVEEYINLFYSKKFNTMLLETDGFTLYDPFATKLINKYSLMYDNQGYDVIRLSEEVQFRRFDQMYRRSIFGALENQDMSLLMKNIKPFCMSYLNNPESIFTLYQMDDIRIVFFLEEKELSEKGIPYISKELIDRIAYPPKPIPINHIPVVKPKEDYVFEDKPEEVPPLTEEEIKNHELHFKPEPPVYESTKDSEGNIIFDPSAYDEEDDEEDVPDNTKIVDAEASLNQPKHFASNIPTQMQPPILPESKKTIGEIENTEYRPVEYTSLFEEFLIHFFWNHELTPFELKGKEFKELSGNLDYDLDTFINIPILLFIMRHYLKVIQ